MGTLPTQVQPGEVISSDLLNAILDELARLGGTVGPGGTQIVPNVFGTLLGDARAMILQPARQLALGFTYDVSGAAIDPLAAANFNLIVLSQSPPPDARVAPNTPVNLVVSRAGSGTTPTTQPPTISRTETPTGTVTTSFPVNAPMVIVGTNFSATASQNTVTLNNVPATVSADPADPTRRLLVVVPPGIPGAPVNPGDPALPNVTVRVQTPAATQATTTITITAPVAGQPTISSVTPATQTENSNITIAGTNFAATAQVLIRGTGAPIVTRTSTEIVATVPNFADILQGAVIPVSLTVLVPGVGEATFAGTFRVRGA
jgi:IPT/TIG domain